MLSVLFVLLSLVTSGCAPGGTDPEEAKSGEDAHGAPDAEHTPPDGVRVSRVEVVLKDGSLVVSTARVPVGWTTFHVKNEGTQIHELEILEDSQEVDELEDLQPGTEGELTLLLSAGAYELACRVHKSGETHEDSTHYSLGEHAALRAD